MENENDNFCVEEMIFEEIIVDLFFVIFEIVNCVK